jgi:hypothetical protein
MERRLTKKPLSDYDSLFLRRHDIARNGALRKRMIDFSKILARLEDISLAPSDAPMHRHPPSISSAIDIEATRARQLKSAITRMEHVNAAYGAIFMEPRNRDGNVTGRSEPNAQGAPILQALLDELDCAADSIEKLQSLRRRFAWICHPDRQCSASNQTTERLMSELNTRIDAALQELRYGFPEKRPSRKDRRPTNTQP